MKTMRSPGQRDARGVALIFALTVIAILTAVGVDFAYNTRVNLHLAAHARDELRAYFLARSAVNMSRLLLHFQRKLDGIPSELTKAFDPRALGGPLGVKGKGPAGGPAGAGAAGAGAAAGATPAPKLGIRLWDLIPIDSGVAQMFLAGGGFDEGALGEEPAAPAASSETAPPPAKSKRSFGDFDGAFHSEIVDEDQKINVLRLDSLFSGAVISTLLELRVMTEDPRYSFVFEQENAHGERPTPADIALYIRDWIDADETNAVVDPNAPNPFAQGFGDEGGPYSHLGVKYHPKNAMLDTVDELYMVAGIGDRFMTAFGDRLTIYSDLSGVLNINTDDPLQMVINILVAAERPDDPALRNPALLASIIEEIKLVKMFSFFGMTLPQFVSILEANKVTVKSQVKLGKVGESNTFLGDHSETFRITATGEVGEVTKTLTAVVRYDDQLGRMMYWRED